MSLDGAGDAWGIEVRAVEGNALAYTTRSAPSGTTACISFG
jgi:hypothetical protein